MRETTLAELNPESTPTAETTEKSTPFVGQCNQLISTTNWEKGKIIQDWRQALKESDAPVSQYADEAWSQLVGGVTPQHVGRLRRASERFGHVFTEYENLYWSHFYAALDWDDAEMWLEGAVQSKWSVSKMRQQRWETLGKLPGDKPDAADIVATEADEETQSLALSEKERKNDRDYIEGPVHEGPDFGDEPTGSRSSSNAIAEMEVDAPTAPIDPVKHFEAFDSLPEDVSEAANAFKVAIITHKASEWEDIPRDDMVGLLDALKQLALAPLS
jgi:hypothetical protein